MLAAAQRRAHARRGLNVLATVSAWAQAWLPASASGADMIRTGLIAALALGLWSPGAAAVAQDNPATTADIRCMVVIAAILSAKNNPKFEAAAPLAMTYYLGRIKGREPELDLQARTVAVFRASQGADIRADAVRCGQEMSVMSKNAADLAARIRALPDTKAPQP